MNASRLADRFHILRDLDLPKTVIYELMDTYTDDDGKPHRELPSIIDALGDALKNATERLKVADFDNVILRARQKFDYGDCPEATWDALDTISNDKAEWEWAKAASSELKKQRPAVKEEADKIIIDFHHAHVAKLYAEHGVLPKIAYEGFDSYCALRNLENEKEVPLDRRARVLERLLAEPQPLTTRRIDEIIIESNDDTKQGAEHEPEQGKQGDKQGDKQGKQGGSGAAGGGGADSKAEIKKLKKEIDDLTKKNNVFKGVIDGRDREIKRLKDEIEWLKADPKGPIDKHAEALVAALKKVRGEKAIEVVEGLCAKLHINPRKLNPPDSKAADIDIAGATARAA
jgi:hypothetical protein